MAFKPYVSTKIVLVDPDNVVKDSLGNDAYVVKYPDGYTSKVPVLVFDKKYILIDKEDKQLIK